MTSLLGLRCQNCGERFGLAAATGKTNPAKLADQFPAICPHCNSQSTYLRSAIEILQVDQEGEHQ